MIGIGYQVRANGLPPLRIVRGPIPGHSEGTHAAAPVPEGTTIYSGQVVHKEWNAVAGRYEWVLGGGAAYHTYWAWNDSFKDDVLAADSLIGLPCSGNYILATPYFTGDADTYVEDAFITFDAATGNIKIAGAADPIIGRVVNQREAEDVSQYDHSGGLSDQLVVTFRTICQPEAVS